MSMKTARRIAAYELGVGESRIQFKQANAQKAASALTREDIRGLIKDGSIYPSAPVGQTRLAGKMRHRQKRKGRRRGHGSRSGLASARTPPKEAWISKVRRQRAFLAALAEEKKLKRADARHIYRMVKGGAFRSVSALQAHLKERKLIV